MKARRWSWAVALAGLLPAAAFAQEQAVRQQLQAQQQAQQPQPQQEQPAAQQHKLVPALGWDAAKQGAFVTSAAVDLQNNVWAGTEGNGLWKYDSRAKNWTQFTSKDGLGDDTIYALAVDKQGRVWAGHLNHGVSVFSGGKWKNYGLLDGPLGDRVFAIATCPTDGDVWIATDCGAARYSVAKDDWDYYTRASGLVSNQIQAIAFDSNGNIFLGTQCDGIAWAKAADGYKKWKTETGPLQPPNAVAGRGMPTGLINSLFISAEPQAPELGEAAMAATPYGSAIYMGALFEKMPAFDGKSEWVFGRGADWEANEKGLYATPDAPGPDPSGIKLGVPKSMPLEDWATCFAEDKNTNDFWTGYRMKGVQVRDQKTDQATTYGGDGTGMVHAICLTAKAPPLIAVSGIKTGGLMTLDDSKAGLEPGPAAPNPAPALPGAPKPADAATLSALAKQLDVFQNQVNQGDAMFLGDDWRTEGDWVGRYGGGFALLCGLQDGKYEIQPGYDVSIGLGIHVKDHGPSGPMTESTDGADPGMRVLYNPSAGKRAEGDVNDASAGSPAVRQDQGGASIKTVNDYPASWEGPDLWLDVKVPEGIHCVSLYFTNYDAQTGDPRAQFRDYDIQVLPWAADKDAVQKSQPLARARVTDFWGGVYKMFVVSGPARYIVRVGRNHSFITNLQGVFIDQIQPDPPESDKTLPGFAAAEYLPPEAPDPVLINKDPSVAAAAGLWDLLDHSFDKRGVAGLQFPLRVIAYRSAAASHAPDALLQGWRWQMGFWTKEDRDAFDKAMAAAHKAYIDKTPPPDDN
ncbi:MAG TPA: two-component regulator propeller domain-containing protein [Chthoniobacteraceae bacterium]|nr:two-component regulator propeller domain-containing protein [Chthoniobacteraceae bacterium]